VIAIITGISDAARMIIPPAVSLFRERATISDRHCFAVSLVPTIALLQLSRN
jgi:hypothetical protein